ncbi:hypothetical protein RLEG12_00705 (plasmid) [Rhizobium leguminosarum bv. trifolii CB782]|nr:hypothetical protein RLEG12_00705 [Rhizobium leguminosarum bv. trifolii CB782]
MPRRRKQQVLAPETSNISDPDGRSPTLCEPPARNRTP